MREREEETASNPALVSPFLDCALFSAWICAVNMGAKPHRGWLSQQGLPNHCHGMHGFLLSPHTCSSSAESPALLRSAAVTCHGRKDPSSMSFGVKNIYSLCNCHFL